ncbi:MAG: AAA family ATPase [Acidobacteriota bacterium]|nr:AAA family ATPase [Acidobacteriota bacterium]
MISTSSFDPQAVWDAMQAKLSHQVGKQCFDTWFRPVACAGGDATTLRLLAPNEAFSHCLLDSYGDLLRQAATDVRGAPCQLVITTSAPEPGPVPSADILPVVQAAALESAPLGRNWLIENLWLAETVGFLGAPPKHFKTWLALEMAVCVASGSPCLGAFAVPNPGPVLLYAAEDSAATVRQRLESLAAHHHVDFERLPLWVITADTLRLDRPDDSSRLEATVAQYQPRFMILDPLIRLHQQDENASGPMAALLGFFRSLQRKSRTAIALTHHSRKGPAPAGSGYSLRGSSDFYAWAYVDLNISPFMCSLQLCAVLL